MQLVNFSVTVTLISSCEDGEYKKENRMNTEQLVFLPGLLCNDRLWANQIAALRDGVSCQVADLSHHESIKEMAFSVLQSVAGNFSLAGLSMGGYVALEIVRLAPERVKRLALIDTKARADNDQQRRRRKGLVTLARTGKFKGVTPHLLPLLIHESRRDDPDLTSVIYRMAQEVGREAFLHQQTAILGRSCHLDLLPAIHCPVAIITGQQDQITPPDCAEEMHRDIPDSRLHILESCGHLAPLEKPETVTRILRAWLAV